VTLEQKAGRVHCNKNSKPRDKGTEYGSWDCDHDSTLEEQGDRQRRGEANSKYNGINTYNITGNAQVFVRRKPSGIIVPSRSWLVRDDEHADHCDERQGVGTSNTRL
jgi:hypothetical protein